MDGGLMKFLHVHDFFAPGNSRFGFDLDRLLAARGHSAHVLAAVGERGPGDGTVIEGVTFHTFPHRGDLQGWKRYRHAVTEFSGRFDELQREESFDVAILNQPLCAAGVREADTAGDVPQVYSFLSPWAAEWRAEHPEAGRFRRWLQAGWRNRMERNALAAADRVFVESAFIRSQLKEHHPDVPDSKLALVPGAVDLARFAPGGSKEEDRARFGLGPGKVVLTVRRLVERMGIDLLMQGAAALPDLELVIGGEGPHRGELQSLAKFLKLDVRFLGHVPDEDLPALYRAADLFVLPTRALEGFGLVAVEAMACGTPAMGTPVGAIPEILDALGLLFEDATPEAIAKGLRRFFELPDAGLGAKCREHVAAHYDWKKRVEEAEKLLLEVTREGARH